MHIIDCPEMKTLPFGKEMAVRKLKDIWGDRQWWEKLDMEDDDRAALLPFMEKEQALIPGLLHDMAIDCIVRVLHRFLPRLRLICQCWCNLVTIRSFRRNRERIGSAEHLIFIVQALRGTAASIASNATDLNLPVYALLVYIATYGQFMALPHLARANSDVCSLRCCRKEADACRRMGSLRLNSMLDVWIVDLVTGEWRKGRPMSAARSFFTCATVGGRVYVAGGHNEMKNTLRTTEINDVEADEWAALLALAKERDES
ncbi:hypothetical protein IEQ34_002968 [Dendrobium chrysotoxum]|uniref:F-box domain-containing protein n=1 Tax=Dendrobium chrysotoxum TaxID=161865 RepID=A0AAV7HIH7_DENCH|nr:hypothetical protein IEQ34_002968 [Dendrobium chrysotoxum]